MTTNRQIRIIAMPTDKLGPQHSQYDTANPSPGPRGVPGLLIAKRLTMTGFLVGDDAELMADAQRDLPQWVKEGRIKVAEDIVEGLENAPAGLIGLLAGDNFGKRMVRVRA